MGMIETNALAGSFWNAFMVAPWSCGAVLRVRALTRDDSYFAKNCRCRQLQPPYAGLRLNASDIPRQSQIPREVSHFVVSALGCGNAMRGLTRPTPNNTQE